ncbi:terminase small subunit [Limosilactobacillus gorillae]|uniref:terminase small subunit n=1 Tax=Limosilactobacillus gorillae TaxID=1450649 RepID=UPI000AF88852|nr:terminase small subunit [Limosilactobacillus gorillae]
MSRKLTVKQKNFADNYIESGNASKAYQLAGYKATGNSAESSASQLLRNPKVKSYIDKRLKQIESDKIADLTEALQGITAIARGEALEPVVTVNPLTGKPQVTTVPSKQSTRLAAWKEIIKRYPNSDEFAETELRIKKANARISEAKAKLLEDNGADVEQVIDSVLDMITKGNANGT